MGRATYDSSQEIRNKKITREEGIALVKKYDGEKPSLFFEDCLKYLNIKEEEFWKIIDNARSQHIWQKSKNDWQLRKPIWK